MRDHSWSSHLRKVEEVTSKTGRVSVELAVIAVPR